MLSRTDQAIRAPQGLLKPNIFGSIHIDDDNEPNETVFDTRNKTIENVEEKSRFLPGILLHTEAKKNPVLATRDHPEDDTLKKWSLKNLKTKKKEEK